MSQQQQFPQRTKSILEDVTLRLSAEPLPNGTGRPTLKFYQCGRNRVRGDVYSNLPNAKNNGLIRADLGYGEFFNVLQTVLLLADPNTPNDSHYSIEYNDYTFFKGQRSDQKKLIHRTIVGKEADGRLYISILSPQNDDVKIKFYFEHPHLCTIKAIGGTPALPEAEISRRAALAWVKGYEVLLGPVLVPAWVDKTAEKAAGGQGGQGGGYNNRGNQGGNGGNGGGYNNGGNRSAAPSDDDMPF